MMAPKYTKGQSIYFYLNILDILTLMKANKTKTIAINEQLHQQLKELADKKGVKLYRLIEKILEQEVK